MRHLLCLIALITPLTLFAAPKFPFPQKATYEYGIMPADIDHDKVQAAYEDFMELYKESSDGSMARIQFDDLSYTVSEGIGYGMLTLVYMDNEKNNTQGKFDKLWKYYNNFLDPKGLMDWKIKEFSGAEGMYDHNSATDGDIDVAIALMEAYKQWGDEKYFTDAKNLIDKISSNDVTTDGYLNPGDSWGASPPKYNPSYFNTAALQVFKEAGTFDWDKVISNSYNLMKKVQNSNTGLIPAWCTKEGTHLSGDDDTYQYDATRIPWRMAWAYCWFGHQDAYDIAAKITSWISTETSNSPADIVDGYQMDGNPTNGGKWNNASFVGPFACGGMVDSKHQEWLDDCYSHLESLDENQYYKISLKVITLLLLSGNMPNLWNYNPVEKFTVSTSATPQQGGTITVKPQGTEFDDGTQITLTAQPAEGYSFVSWSGDATGNSANTTVTVSKDMNVTATFEIKNGINTIHKSNNKSTQIISTESTSGPAISYTIASPGLVSIRVYTTSGELIATPINNVITSRGTHTISLNTSFPAGIYLIQMHTANGKVTGKISLTK